MLRAPQHAYPINLASGGRQCVEPRRTPDQAWLFTNRLAMLRAPQHALQAMPVYQARMRAQPANCCREGRPACPAEPLLPVRWFQKPSTGRGVAERADMLVKAYIGGPCSLDRQPMDLLQGRHMRATVGGRKATEQGRKTFFQHGGMHRQQRRQRASRGT